MRPLARVKFALRKPINVEFRIPPQVIRATKTTKVVKKKGFWQTNISFGDHKESPPRKTIAMTVEARKAIVKQEFKSWVLLAELDRKRIIPIPSPKVPIKEIRVPAEIKADPSPTSSGE